MITIDDIKEGARFKTDTGIIWNIDQVKDGLVRTSMDGGQKGRYLDTLEELVIILNEEQAKKIK